MKHYIKYIYYLMAIALAFGSFNPSSLASGLTIDAADGEQHGYTPLLFALCVLLSLLDVDVRKHWSILKPYTKPLVSLVCCYILSTLIYDLNTAFDYLNFIIKFAAAISGFCVISMYFIQYPKELTLSIRIYAATCCLICVAFFTGRLDGFYYYSNGRLFLFGENPNSYSFLMGLAVIILTRELYNKWHLWVKLSLVLLSALIIFYIFLSGSRGTILILVLAQFVFNSQYIKKHPISFSVVTGFIIISVGLFLERVADDISVFDRFQSLSEGNEREDLISNALGLFWDRPITGFGLNGYKEMKIRVFNDMRDSHNMIVSIMATSGILGLISISIYLKRILGFLLKHKNPFTLSIFVYVFFISMKTGGILTYSMMWFTYALLFAQTYSENESKLQI